MTSVQWPVYSGWPVGRLTSVPTKHQEAAQPLQGPPRHPPPSDLSTPLWKTKQMKSLQKKPKLKLIYQATKPSQEAWWSFHDISAHIIETIQFLSLPPITNWVLWGAGTGIFMFRTC